MTPWLAATAFIAGFLAVLIFHQGVWALWRAAGKAPTPPWVMTRVPPLGVPAVISASFWGGLWAIVLVALLPVASPYLGYWAVMVGLGGLLTTMVALMVVAPIKGRPFAAGWNVAIWIFALSVNIAWGFGAGLLLQLITANVG